MFFKIINKLPFRTNKRNDFESSHDLSVHVWQETMFHDKSNILFMLTQQNANSNTQYIEKIKSLSYYIHEAGLQINILVTIHIAVCLV